MATTRDDEKDKKKKEAEANGSPDKGAPARESRGVGRDIADALSSSISKGVSEHVSKSLKDALRDTGIRGNDKASPLLVSANQTEDARLARYETLTVGAAADAQRVKALADQAELDAEAGYKPGAAGKAGGLLGGAFAGPFGSAIGGAAGNLIARQAAGAAARKKTFDENNMMEGNAPRSLAERDSNKDGGSILGSTPGTPKAPVANESEAVAAKPAAPTFDDFVAKARKKKGYMSTILAGNVSAAVPQGKALYGS